MEVNSHVTQCGSLGGRDSVWQTWKLQEVSCLYPNSNGKSKKALNGIVTNGCGMEKALSGVGRVKIRGRKAGWLLQRSR